MLLNKFLTINNRKIKINLAKEEVNEFTDMRSMGFIVNILTVAIFFVIFGSSFLNIVLSLKNFPSSLNAVHPVKASELANPEKSDGRLPDSRNKKLPALISDAGNFNLESNCGMAVDVSSNKVLFSKEEEKEWPIASITKLMAALVFVEVGADWEKVYTITADDRREGGKINVFNGEKIKIVDLFNTSLVGSDNTATIALIHSTGMSEEEYVKKMNEKASELGLTKTFFYDAVGLRDKNVSTAREVIELAKAALAVKEIQEATLKKKYEYKTIDGRKKAINNTDDLLDNFPQNGIKILGGKTGYNDAAGYCFVGKFSNHEGKEIISVVLGAKDNNSRFLETKSMVEWAYKSFIW